jgi:TPR repeat protein
MIRVLFAIAAACAIVPCQANAQVHSNFQTECDRLTAWPDDPRRIAPPVSWEDRDPARAIPACRAALDADPTNPRLMFQMGLALDKARRFQESFRFHMAAAQRGYPAAQWCAGFAYEQGLGIARDEAQAARLYTDGAKAGYAPSQNALANLLADGRGVDMDVQAAVVLYRRAADQDYWAALLNLGYAYRDGKHVGQDFQQAARWFARGAQIGNARGKYELALLVLAGHATGGYGARDAFRMLAEAERDGVTDARTRLTLLIEREPHLLEEIQKARANSAMTPRNNPFGTIAAAMQPPPTLPPPAPRSAPKSSVSGSGFFINANGEILTNNHVVEDCGTSAVSRLGAVISMATVAARNARDDLAVLSTGIASPVHGVLRGGKPIRPADSVVVYGYPLSGSLSSLGNTTLGAVTALTGLGDDYSTLQISAPVQPGSSGAPVMDSAGRIVAIVVARYKTTSMVVPQNINFAIKGNVAQGFLEARQIQHSVTDAGQELQPADISEMASRFTVLIDCIR